jgi:hypothetical protein
MKADVTDHLPNATQIGWWDLFGAPARRISAWVCGGVNPLTLDFDGDGWS